VLDGNPDLYGPFWIATTVVVILFMTGTISEYLARLGKGHFVYDFRLLSGTSPNAIYRLRVGIKKRAGSRVFEREEITS